MVQDGGARVERRGGLGLVGGERGESFGVEGGLGLHEVDLGVGGVGGH